MCVLYSECSSLKATQVRWVLALVWVKRYDSLISISIFCVKFIVYFILHNIKIVIWYLNLLHREFQGRISWENFFMFYCCKDYKNVTRDNKLCQSRFFVHISDFGSFLLKYKKFLGLKLESSISQKIRSFFRVGFFIFWAWKVASWDIRNFLGFPLTKI